MTNFIADPSGVLWSATSDMGYYWAGFGVGLFLVGFYIVLRMARNTGKHSPDF